MGLFKGAMKAGLAAKAMNVVRREASKPENQQKAKEMLNKMGNRGKGKPRS